MRITEVVETAHNIHPCGEGSLLLDHVTGAPGETGQPLAERRIQPFNVSRVDDLAAV